MTTNENINTLWQKYADRKATVAEEDQLMAYLHQPEFEATHLAFLENRFGTEVATQPLDREYWQQKMETIWVTEEQEQPVRVRRILLLKTVWFRYAAVLLLIAGTATFLYLHNRPQQDITQKQPTTIPPDVQPGGNKAILTLDDGSTIVLDNAANGALARQGNTRIIKLNTGALAYNAGAGGGAIGYNTISTPKGGQYQITLPDNSKVWLNAASSIKFPYQFSGNTRDVVITGEVYLEIAQNSKTPFGVIINGAKIDVLGTSFNVNAYENEEAIETTLLEGVVRVNAYGHLQTLKPGQQAQIYAGSPVRVVDGVNVRQVIAWKNGYFDFDNAALPVVMRQLERWYDIAVSYEGKTPDVIFKGKMDRNVQLSDIVDLLSTFGIKARLQGRNLVISGS